jgi:hypothetical protein
MASQKGEPEILSDTAHEARVSNFKEDLQKDKIQDVIRKHITTGDPTIIPRDIYFELRRRVSQQFDLHPSEIVSVGSCRLGFSLKRKGRTRERYNPAKATADVDLAIVSPGRFDSYWDRVFDLVRKNRDWSLSKGAFFTRDLFNGWITPSKLPNLPQFTDAVLWTEFFDELTRSRLCGMRTVKPRLYRSWNRLEAYQEIMVTECRNELIGERH